MSVMSDYAAAIVRACTDRRSLAPVSGLLLGGAGALALWRQATSPLPDRCGRYATELFRIAGKLPPLPPFHAV